MARYFDAQAALAEIQAHPISPIHPICGSEASKNRTNRTNRVPPDPDAFEERAALIEIDAGLSRRQAEDMAAKAQGYDNVIAFSAAVQLTQEGDR